MSTRECWLAGLVGGGAQAHVHGGRVKIAGLARRAACSALSANSAGVCRSQGAAGRCGTRPALFAAAKNLAGQLVCWGHPQQALGRRPAVTAALGSPGGHTRTARDPKRHARLNRVRLLHRVHQVIKSTGRVGSQTIGTGEKGYSRWRPPPRRALLWLCPGLHSAPRWRARSDDSTPCALCATFCQSANDASPSLGRPAARAGPRLTCAEGCRR